MEFKDKLDMAKKAKKYFASVFNKDNDVKHGGKINCLRNEDMEIEMFIAEVETKLPGLNTLKAGAPDNFFFSIWEELVYKIPGPVASIFSKSIKLGIVWYESALANVASTFNKWQKWSDAIVILIVWNLWEQILEKKIMKEVNGEWDNMQPGFTTGRLCQNNFISFLKNVTNFLGKEHVDLTDLEYSEISNMGPPGKLY